jgi:hypothetical protein
MRVTALEACLHAQAKMYSTTRTQSFALSQKGQQALQILPTAEAGPYAIQPLKATGDAGVAALGK